MNKNSKSLCPLYGSHGVRKSYQPLLQASGRCRITSICLEILDDMPFRNHIIVRRCARLFAHIKAQVPLHEFFCSPYHSKAGDESAIDPGTVPTYPLIYQVRLSSTVLLAVAIFPVINVPRHVMQATAVGRLYFTSDTGLCLYRSTDLAAFTQRLAPPRVEGVPCSNPEGPPPASWHVCH